MFCPCVLPAVRTHISALAGSHPVVRLLAPDEAERHALLVRIAATAADLALCHLYSSDGHNPSSTSPWERICESRHDKNFQEPWRVFPGKERSPWPREVLAEAVEQLLQGCEAGSSKAEVLGR